VNGPPTMLPNFPIVGAGKAGTTSLYEYLSDERVWPPPAWMA